MANETKDEVTEDAEHRLHGIVVHEVSLVDRAANKRRFLLVKRDGMANETKKQEGEEEEAEENGEETEGAPAALALPSEAKAAIGQVMAGLLKNMVTMAQAIESAEENEDAEPMPAELASGMVAVKEALGELVDKFAATSDNGEEEKSESEGSEMSEETKNENGAMDENVQGALRESGFDDDTIAALSVLLGSKQNDVSKSDHDKAIKSIDALAKMLDVADAPAPAIAPIAPAPTAKGDGQTKELLTAVETLTNVTKKQANELAAIKKSAATQSNAIAVEGSNRIVKNDFEWPMDMNRPITEETVQKNGDPSFY